MNNRTKLNLCLLAALVLVGTATLLYTLQETPGDTSSASQDGVLRDDAARIKQADSVLSTRRSADAPIRPLAVNPAPAPAPTTVDARSTPQTLRATLSAKSGVRPERVSAAIPAKPFDLEAWQDPKSPYRAQYLANPEFGRVWQPLSAGQDVPKLQAAGGDFFRLKATPATSKVPQQVSFAVKGLPDVPVSASCFDGAYFSKSQLGTITVATGKDGLARFTVEIPAGMAGRMKVVCASPMMSGQVRVTLDIKP